MQMTRWKITRVPKIFFCTAFIGAMSSSGCASYVSPEALSPPAEKFSSSLGSFAEVVRKEHLGQYRRDTRQDSYIGTVRDVFGTPKWDAKTVSEFTKPHTPEIFLCLPRYGYQRVALRASNLEAVSKALGDTLQTPSDDIIKLLRALGADYTLKVDPKKASSTFTEWQLTMEEGKRCSAAVKGADPFVTRTWVGNEAGPIAAFIAGAAAVEAIWAIVKPAVLGTFKAVDLERRNNAVKKYFANVDNVNALKADLTGLEIFLDQEFKLEQTRAAGRAVAAAKALFDPAGDHWKALTKAASSEKCRSPLALWAKAKTDPQTVACLDDVLATDSAVYERALITADAFDVAMDKQMPVEAERLSAQLDTLAKIASGHQASDGQIKALWATTLRYMALFKTLEEASSEENRKKINDAIDAFLKTLKQ